MTWALKNYLEKWGFGHQIYKNCYIFPFCLVWFRILIIFVVRNAGEQSPSEK